MKKIFKIAVAYFIGMMLLFTLTWRVESLDKNNISKSSSNTQNTYAYSIDK